MQFQMLRRFNNHSIKTNLAAAFMLLSSLVWLAACRPVPAKTEVLVSSAISLKDTMVELAAEFEKEHPNSKIIFNFGASGQLCQQISQGAPADLFISASVKQMEELSKKGLLSASSIHDCASNRLVLISAQGRLYSSISELSRLDRLAIGNPKTVPAGEYARQALEKAKLYDSLAEAGKLVFAQDARQILAYVEGGDVDAGIVYNTDARLAQKSKVCFSIPQSCTSPILYQVATLKDSSKKELVQQFAEFVTGPQAKQAFQRRGFCP